MPDRCIRQQDEDLTCRITEHFMMMTPQFTFLHFFSLFFVITPTKVQTHLLSLETKLPLLQVTSLYGCNYDTIEYTIAVVWVA